MDMGDKIKKLREAQQLTLEELGNRVGVGKSTVRKWENGIIANMRRDKIAKIADALNCSPAYLMGWDEEKIASIEREAKERADREDAIEEDLRQKLIKMDSEKLEILNEILKFEPTTEELNQILEYTQFITGRRR